MSRTKDGVLLWERCALHSGGGLFLVIVGCAIYALLFQPTHNLRRQRELQLRDITEVIEDEPETIASYQETLAMVRELQEHIDQVSRRLPAHPDVNRLLREVTALAQQHDVKVLSMQPAQQIVGDLAASQHVKLRIVGSYASICKLLHEMSDFDSIAWITGIKIATNGNDDRLQPVDLDIVLLFAPPKTVIGQMSNDSEESQET